MVPIRNRPRFTISEAVLLNALVNAAPEAVTIHDLCRRLAPFGFSLRFKRRDSVLTHISSLRAKLGDIRYRPQIIRTRYDESGMVVAYYWNDTPEEHDAADID
jgi:DNA-binding winged helix-turn-helix (wHTH) protein